MDKVCCVTGHRAIPDAEMAAVTCDLRQQVQQALDDGYTVFLSGFAEGADLLFAQIVLEAKASRPDIRLEAAIPHGARVRHGSAAFQALYAQCDAAHILSPRYHPQCFALRNRYMVEHAQRVIAVYDGRDYGGTLQTIRMAIAAARELRVVRVPTAEGKVLGNADAF